jgi:hypothetical protein
MLIARTYRNRRRCRARNVCSKFSIIEKRIAWLTRIDACLLPGSEISVIPYEMCIRNVIASVGLSMLFVAASAFGQKSTIEGSALDTNNKPLKNAEVRIQNEKAKSAPTLIRTDAKGHFIAGDLPAGTYTATVFLNGTVKWSAAHVKATNGKVVYLNLNEHPAVAVAKNQPKKRAVWIPDSTGSRLGGHWEDEPVRGPGTNDVDRMGTHQLDTMQRALPAQGLRAGGP